MNSRCLCDEKSSPRRAKSLCSLNEEVITKKAVSNNVFTDKRSRTVSVSESSMEAYAIHRTDSETSLEGHEVINEHTCSIDVVEQLSHLEQKMDRLSDLFLEQCRILSAIKGEIQNSRAVIEKSDNIYSQMCAQVTDNIITNPAKEWNMKGDDYEDDHSNSRARTLLDAIEIKPTMALHAHAPKETRDALTRFLQSDEVVERVVGATAAAAREAVRACVSRDVAALYVPALQRAHRRLAHHAARAIDDAFMELEEQSSQASRRMQRAARQLRRALERHQRVLENAPHNQQTVDSLKHTVQRILDSEMKQWRQKILESITAEISSEYESGIPASPTPSSDYQEVYSPGSSSQPSDPEHSIVDQLMQAALLKQQACADSMDRVQGVNSMEGVEAAFWRALCSGHLPRVVALCRAAPPGAGLHLPPPHLLALLQQLATDMLHDTALKCRYLEEAIISLNPSEPSTRPHLPLVVGEVRRHLLAFLASYPNHVASRRIKLILMAAEKLLKYCG
ncbi:unnamed protein product [Chilo suppressalis]|uniref:Enhancer of mRNA-decapping protein 4 C-terminal domain-containing protein n=1 Tax=Chilo suppressalis TaxID=168631 RepID=A0ABN8L678_CHISP|nr:unnamed protein product [Chilo suppressalis]